MKQPDGILLARALVGRILMKFDYISILVADKYHDPAIG